MQDKTNQKKAAVQVRPPIAGIIPGDYNIEFIGIRETKQVFILQNGNTVPFSEIPGTLKARIYNVMLKDEKAMADLRHLGYSEALERFVFCLFGDTDSNPDVLHNGKISPAENFRCGTDCICLQWDSKNITINGQALTKKQIAVADALSSDKPDKQIADELGIQPSTLVVHKRNIYEKAGVQSRAGLVAKVHSERLITCE